MQVINFGTQIESCSGFEVTPGNFFCQNTILDADIIFWNVESTYNYMPHKPLLINFLTSSQKDLFTTGIKTRKIEFKEFFAIGRTLIITSPTFYNYQYKLKEDASKTEVLNIWDCLEISPPECSKNNGKNIETIDYDFANDFLGTNKNVLYYNRRIDRSSGIPLFFIKDTKHIVGEYYKVDKGLIIVIPEFKRISVPAQKPIFLEKILNLSKGLLTIATLKEAKFPELVEQYSLNGEMSEQSKLEDLIKQRTNIENQIEKQNLILKEYRRMKLLFAGDGELLEYACKEIFENIGFEVTKPEGNRDDLIIKLDEKVAVIEIKGVSKSSAERHSAQLQKWVSDYHTENGIIPKGILIVNTYKNLGLDKRIEDDFPDQMMKHVKQMGHCLVTGIQMLAMYLDYRAEKIERNKIVKILFENIGEIKYTKDIDQYVSIK
jgi:hypothetical protein